MPLRQWAAAKAKPIDLAKAFSFLDKRLVTPSKPKARLEMRPPEVEIPMADSEDVVSVVSQVARVGRQTEADPEEEELSEPAVTLAALNGPVNQADEPTYIGEVPLERKRLQPNLGTLRLHITDDNGTQINATVLIDGQSRGSASKLVSVTAGGHHLRIEAPGYRSFERHIEVIGGGSLSLTAALEPKTLSPK